MAVDKKLILHWVNVIIRAEYHNPSILNPDFLTTKSIVPSDWKATEVLTTPAFALVKYPEDVVFILDRERLQIKKDCQNSFQEDYSIHDFASQYVFTLPHVRYTALGFNWHISMEIDDPAKWIIQRFLNPDSWNQSGSKLIGSSVKLSFEVNNAVCNVDFKHGKAKIKNEEFRPAIIVNANFHHQGPSSPEEINMLITNWKERENYLRELLPKLIGKIV